MRLRVGLPGGLSCPLTVLALPLDICSLPTVFSLNTASAGTANPLRLLGDPVVPWPGSLCWDLFSQDTTYTRWNSLHTPRLSSEAFTILWKDSRGFLDCFHLIGAILLPIFPLLTRGGPATSWEGVLQEFQKEVTCLLGFSTHLFSHPPSPPPEAVGGRGWGAPGRGISFPKFPPPASGWAFFKSLPFPYYLCTLFTVKTLPSSLPCWASGYFKAHLWDFWENAFSLKDHWKLRVFSGLLWTLEIWKKKMLACMVVPSFF